MNKYIQGALTAVMIAALGVAAASCSDDDMPADPSQNHWDISGNTIVDFKPERLAFIPNPINGWNTYTGLGDGLRDSFWEDYDNMPTPEGKVRVSDYSNTLYIRGAWSDFNPEEGKYVWDDGVLDTKPAKRFKMLVEGAKERGMQLAFTFVVDSRDKHYNFTPAYVKEQGCEGYYTTTGSVQVWSPYPDDPVFQRCYEKFLTDFAAKYNDPAVTAYVSGFGLGMWGETHTLIYSTGNDEPREAVFEWIVTLMERLFTKVPTFINYHRCILAKNDFNNASTASAEKYLDYCVEHGFSLRHDAFGMKQYYKDWEP